jgi:hypothetical protein
MRRAFLTCLLVVPVQVFAEAAEVQVNVRPAGDQKNAAVATSAAGGSVIVWASYYSTSGRSYDILARRLDSQGGFLGEEFLVNAVTQGNQNEPAVAMDGQGRFAVVWQGPGLDEEDIFLRLFGPDGIALTGEVLVNVDTVGRQLYPSVAAGGTGTLVVVWESQVQTTDGEKTTVYAQRFDPNGSGLGGAIVVDTGTYDARDPEVAVDAGGRFAVTWMRDRSIHPILARLFSAEGVPLTEPFQVNTTGISSVTRPSIAMNSLGYFVVAWDGHPSRASEDDIYARLYDPNGVPRGEPFVVNTILAGPQEWPRVALGDRNEFIIVWEHDTGDPNATEIAGRYFDGTGVPLADQFQLNTYILDEQRYPDVAMAGDGSYLAAWESNGQDGSGYGIFATLGPSLLPLLPADPNEED